MGPACPILFILTLDAYCKNADEGQYPYDLASHLEKNITLGQPLLARGAVDILTALNLKYRRISYEKIRLEYGI